MTLALFAVIAFGFIAAVSRLRLFEAAAAAPLLVILVGWAASVIHRGAGLPGLPADWVAAVAEAGLAALVFASAAQLRVSRFAKRCPASFRLTFGAGPLFMVVSALAAFVMLPQLSAPSAVLLGAVLMLNGAAFDRRVVTRTPAPAPIKTAVRIESAAIIAFGAPVAILAAAFASAPATGETPLAPLFHASIELVVGFALGGACGFVAARYGARAGALSPATIAFASGFAAFMIAALIGANAVIAAGAAGLVWGEQTDATGAARLKLRRAVERAVPTMGYFLFGCALAPRLLQADLLSVLFAAAAVTAMRAGPRLAILQATSLPQESKVFLAWFGGAPGAASALFLLALLDDAMIVEHEALLTVAALAIAAGVVAARLTARPLANSFLRQSAMARRRRMYAG